MTEFENKNPELNQEEEAVVDSAVEIPASAEGSETVQAEQKEEPTVSTQAQEGESEPADEADGQESFADAFEKTMNRIHNGQIIKGTIVQISNGEVCVNIGYKSDGYIPKA